MSGSDRVAAFADAWRRFEQVDASLDVIFDKYRRDPVGTAAAPQAGGAMTDGDRAEVARLQAEIARLAPTLAAMRLPNAGPFVQLTEKQVIQAHRLAGWPQWQIERKLAGEQFVRLDRRLGLLLSRLGIDRHAAVTREQIAALDIADADREELLQVQREWERAAARADHLATRVEPQGGRPVANADTLAAWFRCVGKAEAICDFRAAMQELMQYLQAYPMTPDEVMSQFGSVVEQRVARLALEVAPVDRGLRDIGFRPQSEDGPDLRWRAVEWGRTLLVSAGPGRAGHWCLTGWHKVAGEWRRLDAEVAEQEPRGKVAAILLSMWRQAFGPAVRPPGVLDLGRLYEQHREKFGRLEIDLPRLELDGRAFRAMRQRLRRRFGRGAGAVATLAVVDGVLRVSVAGSVFKVPARGGFGVDCTVAVGDLIGIPPSCLRGRVIRMERGWSALTIDWYSMPFTHSPPRVASGAPGQAATGNGLTQAPGVYYQLLTGTLDSRGRTAGDTAASDAVAGDDGADDADTGPDLQECFFTNDRSDSAFELLGYLKCPLTATASSRLARAGWTPDADGLIAAKPFAGKFWWVRGSVARVYPGAGPGSADDVQTTEDLFAAIARGYPAIVMDGPFDNRDDGHCALDLAWEAPDS